MDTAHSLQRKALLRFRALQINSTGALPSVYVMITPHYGVQSELFIFVCCLRSQVLTHTRWSSSGHQTQARANGRKRTPHCSSIGWRKGGRGRTYLSALDNRFSIQSNALLLELSRIKCLAPFRFGSSDFQTNGCTFHFFLWSSW